MDEAEVPGAGAAPRRQAAWEEKDNHVVAADAQHTAATTKTRGKQRSWLLWSRRRIPSLRPAPRAVGVKRSLG